MTSKEPEPVRFIAGLEEIASRYDVILCDVWGVIHNGIAGLRASREALTRFRERGGAAILITNAPRPGERRRRPARPARPCRARLTTASSPPAT